MIPYKDADPERDPPPSAISPVGLVDLEEEPMTFASRRIETIREHPERPHSSFDDEDDGAIPIPPQPIGPPPAELV